ncbi:DEAD/DEAH box helicase [Streptomyces sp. NBC_00193]|uniref:DEAD/DEAH box helicase n=1 Tax=Streptomyces sp. NBC_00193 TaxID=2975675 RepID=UPI00224F1F5E|nr:DEAD/DEAH box helicase [Streptomyces sp. NBC_00193]MCX5294989.1 DEAD/DEAH box helicase [Streptomyces sp. NBC_00193]
MEREARHHLRGVVEDVGGWHKLAVGIVEQREPVETAAEDAARQFLGRVASLGTKTTTTWRVLQVSPSDVDLVTALACRQALPVPTANAQQGIHQLTDDASRALTAVRALFGARRIFSGKGRKDEAGQAATYLASLHERAASTGLITEMEGLASWDRRSVPAVGPSAILDNTVGFSHRLGAQAELIGRHELDAAKTAIGPIDRALNREDKFRTAVNTAGNAVRQAEVRKLVAEMPVERLKDATNGQLRITALVDAGIRNVQQVLDQKSRIRTLPGVGETTGTRMVGAAQTIWQTTMDEMPVRIDIKNRSQATTKLLTTMRAWDAARSIRSATADLAAADAVRPLLQSLDPRTSHVVLVPQDRTVAQLRAALAAVERRGAVLDSGAGVAGGDPWEDFSARPADYYAMLAELGFLADDAEKSQGDLPAEIVEAVRELKLNTTHLKASLRGYQSFGARFAIVQRKVIIGDEMGLGKTVESLAVLAHLRAKGSSHFLVVCPAAVVTNWVREVQAKSDLRAYRLHGPGRDDALKSWIRNGGVAVTTYDILGWLEGQIPERAEPACLVFDEAHYIKNPDAQRTRRSTALIHTSERAILLTGTPLENRIEEFRNLVGYLRPDLSISASEIAPRQFRKQVAPAYLRRNQEDVLTELPERVDVDEWIPMSSADERHYRTAVIEGNFMAMRQAALRAGAKSAKMQRLIDIVQEAEDNERKVLVFSYFRDVLDEVASILPGKVFGPLTGSVPAAKRQSMVDEFSQARHGAVLVAQIVAGGVGLNIQAASVVVICEPQFKPTTEWQAIGRSHRMGQLESVQVHRLLSEEGVDQRLIEILARKNQLFAEFARVSETADSAPEAFDITDAELAREIVAAERERLLAGG